MKAAKPANGTARRIHGFTLIELMIVVAILAILAAISYPSYLDFMRKGWRAEARSALMQQMQQQERQYTMTGQYRRYEGGSGEGGAGAEAAKRRRRGLDPIPGGADLPGVFGGERRRYGGPHRAMAAASGGDVPSRSRRAPAYGPRGDARGRATHR